LKILAVLIATFAVGCVATAQAQIVSDMTPERIREAIGLGSGTKELKPYVVQEKTSAFKWSGPVIAVYTTPFLRVALAANAAKRQYVQFSETDVTQQMTAPEIHVFAPSVPAGGTRIANVKTIVLIPVGSKDLSQTIRPKQMLEATQEYKNLFGFTGQGQAQLAVFPLDAWHEGNEIHVVFDRAISASSGSSGIKSIGSGCSDCKVRISLDKIR
jgi:hypothetical protein